MPEDLSQFKIIDGQKSILFFIIGGKALLLIENDDDKKMKHFEFLLSRSKAMALSSGLKAWAESPPKEPQK